MGRPYDWSALGLGSDPTPGNVGSIRTDATGLRSVSTLITNQANKLRTLSTAEGWKSEAGTEFHKVSGDLADAILKARGRYTGVATALDNYANDLEDIQATADGYLSDANTGKSDWREAYYRDLPADKTSPEYKEENDQRTRDLAAAQGVINSAKGKIATLTSAGGTWDTANRTAAAAIRTASTDDLTDDGLDWLKQLIHGARGVLNFIKDALAVIAIALAAALLVCLILFPGTTAIGILLLAALIVAIVNFVIVAAQAFAGDATGEDVAWAFVDVVLAFVGLKGASAIGNIASRLGNSISHSAGYAARVAGGSYGEAFQAMKALITRTSTSAVVTTMDQFLSGGLMQIAAISVAGTSAKAGSIVIKGMPWLVGGVLGSIRGSYSIGETVVNFLKGDLFQNLDRIQVGSL